MKRNTSFFQIGIKYFIFVIIAMICFGVGAAQDTFAQQRRPCSEDVAKFCKDVQPGGGAMAKCLKDHESELSQVCKEHISQMEQRVEDFKEACQSDAAKFCKDVKAGGGRILRCLKEHEAELSPACKAKMTK